MTTATRLSAEAVQRLDYAATAKRQLRNHKLPGDVSWSIS